jgi:hypothetical protein
MNRGLCRSDPHLAATLAIFARLNACEAITSLEQVASPGPVLFPLPGWSGQQRGAGQHDHGRRHYQAGKRGT